MSNKLYIEKEFDSMIDDINLIKLNIYSINSKNKL